MKIRSKAIKGGDFEGLFPFLILILVGVIRLLKAKKKKATQEQPPPQRRPDPTPQSVEEVPPMPPQTRWEEPLKQSRPEYRALQVKRDEHFWRKRKKTRIQALVQSTGSKRKMFLLSEILRTPKF